MQSITTCMAAAIANMKYLKSCSVLLSSASQSIFYATQINNTQLEHFGCLVDSDVSVEETFKSLQAAQSISTVSSLALQYSDTFEIVDASHTSLIGFGLNLKNLTSLDITCEIAIDIPIIIIDILQNLRMLKNLALGEITMDEETGEEFMYDNPSSSIQTGILESVCLIFSTLSGRKSILKPNYLLALLLRSCPNLKRFDLSASEEVYADGAINLDFRENHLLQHIQINMPDCRYYTFYHAFGGIGRTSMKKSCMIILHQSKKINYHSLLI